MTTALRGIETRDLVVASVGAVALLSLVGLGLATESAVAPEVGRIAAVVLGVVALGS